MVHFMRENYLKKQTKVKVCRGRQEVVRGSQQAQKRKVKVPTAEQYKLRRLVGKACTGLESDSA